MNASQNARQGFTEGWIQPLGVRRRWRKRGVATAMICKANVAMALDSDAGCHARHRHMCVELAN